MNDGMKLILERMQTNPEEFYTGSRWRVLVDNNWDIFTAEERKMYEIALRSTLGDKFSEEVVKTLMEDQNETLKYKMAGRYASDIYGDSIVKKLEELKRQADTKMRDALVKEIYK